MMKTVSTEKNAQPKSWESRFIWQTFWGTGPKRWGRNQDVWEILQQKPGSQNIKKLPLKKTRYLKLRNLLLFYGWGMRKSGLTEIIILICTSAIWGQYPVFSHPESLQSVFGGHCSGLMATTSFVYWYGRQHFSFTADKGRKRLHKNCLIRKCS